MKALHLDQLETFFKDKDSFKQFMEIVTNEIKESGVVQVFHEDVLVFTIISPEKLDSAISSYVKK